jgi:hypothetical protein
MEVVTVYNKVKNQNTKTRLQKGGSFFGLSPTPLLRRGASSRPKVEKELTIINDPSLLSVV